MSEDKQQLCDNGFDDRQPDETTKVTPRHFSGITGFYPIHYSHNAVKCLGIIQMVIGIMCLILFVKSSVPCDGHRLQGYSFAMIGGIMFIATGLFKVLTVNKPPKRCFLITAMLIFTVEILIEHLALYKTLLMRYFPNYNPDSDSKWDNYMAFWITLSRLVIDGSLLSIVNSVCYSQNVIRRLPPSKRPCSSCEPGFEPSLLHLSDGLSVHHGFLEPPYPKDKYKMRVKQIGIISLIYGILLMLNWVIIVLSFSEQTYTHFSFYIRCSVLIGIWGIVIGILGLLIVNNTRNKCFVIGLVVMRVLYFCAITIIPFYEIIRANMESKNKYYYITPLYFFDVWYSEFHVNGSMFIVIMSLMAFLESAVVFVILALTCLLMWSAMGCLTSYVTTDTLHVIDGYQYHNDMDFQKGYIISSKSCIQEI